MSGLVIALAGMLLLFWIIPNHTETVDFGWLRPATLPSIMSIIMVITGLLHFIIPTGKAELDGALTLRFTLIFVLCLGALFLMRHIGFIYVAPALALIVMLMIGERRPLWLFTGIILAPVSLWAVVVFVLKRSLP
jgi:putative tricarboxylic transport membrane protein